MLIASEMRWSMKNHEEKIKRKSERKLKIFPLRLIKNLRSSNLPAVAHPTPPSHVAGLFLSLTSWNELVQPVKRARLVRRHWLRPSISASRRRCRSCCLTHDSIENVFFVLLKRTYVHERAPQEWEKFMACMLLFHAIHFMTLKHCKHDGEQHRAAHFLFPFSPKFYGIRNFIYAELTFCAFSELWRRRQLGRKIS